VEEYLFVYPGDSSVKGHISSVATVKSEFLIFALSLMEIERRPMSPRS
jgi:hypothetical protein